MGVYGKIKIYFEHTTTIYISFSQNVFIFRQGPDAKSKEIEKCAYNNSEENEEGFESGEGTLPFCFSSLKLLKQNVYNVSNQKSSRHDVEYS